MWNAVADVLKKDIAEFVTVVKSETQEVVTSAVAKDIPPGAKGVTSNDRKMFTEVIPCTLEH